uniref:TIL domain-containing protein n=1 Tax=Glossina palpalis gambiensis TaxID=67801 RepID=A0A1B0AMI6_9MUSC
MLNIYIKVFLFISMTTFTLSLDVLDETKWLCGMNEKYTECWADCVPSCVDPKPNCQRLCIQGCTCLPGFFKNSISRCVPASKCN